MLIKIILVINYVKFQGYKNLQGTSNAARKLIDGMHFIADSVTSVSQKPTKLISDWMTDQIAPDYWVPNSKITVSILLPILID